MSALIAEKQQQRTQSQAQQQRRRVYKTQKLVRRQTKSEGILKLVVIVPSLFMVFFVFSYMAVALVGNIQLEQGRRERITMGEKTRAIRQDIARLQQEVDEASNLMSVTQFAQTQGMVLSGETTAPPQTERVETRVAQIY